MSLVRHANSPYWYMSFMVNGESIFRSTKTANKALAQKIENETRRQFIEGAHFEKKEAATLQQVIDQYLATKRKPKMTSNEERSFAQIALLARKIVGYKLDNITGKPIEVYGFDPALPFHELKTKDLVRLMVARRSEGISMSTFVHEVLFLNALIKTAKQFGYETPDIDIKEFKRQHKVKQDKKPIRYLTAAEEKRLLAELEPNNPVRGWPAPEKRSEEQKRIRQDNYDLVITLLDTGARHEEIARLEWSQIDLPDRQVRLIRGKTKNESTLHMTDRLFEVLNRRSQNKHSEQYVFTNKNGGHRNYNLFGLAGAMRRAGIEGCSFHTLRKTLASKLVRNGLAISDVSAILGHASVNMTASYYASLSPSEASKRALAILNV